MVFNPHAHLENPELAEQNAKLNQEYDSINVTAEDLDVTTDCGTIAIMIVVMSNNFMNCSMGGNMQR